MRTSLLLIAATLVAVAACSDNAGLPEQGQQGTGNAQLAIVNTLPAGSGTTLRLDAASVTLPASGTTSRLSVASGAHQLQLQSAAGHVFASVNFSIDPDSSRTVVVSGTTDTAVVSVPVDSNLNAPSGGVGIPQSGHILLINSALGVGPFDVTISRANVDSTVHLSDFAFGAGSAQSPAAYRYNFPFSPDTYTFTVSNPGTTTALATAQITLAIGDQWTAVLTNAGGTLTLTATRQ
ncbi:MAG TPA: hypothetical protein VGM77_04675 [Gemmatimonadales bacterium]|jgi:hypothetical protein